MIKDWGRAFWETEGEMEVLDQRRIVFKTRDGSDGQRLPEGTGRWMRKKQVYGI